MIDVSSLNLLKGKKALVTGMANDQSIAWGCAKAFQAFGADIADCPRGGCRYLEVCYGDDDLSGRERVVLDHGESGGMPLSWLPALPNLDDNRDYEFVYPWLALRSDPRSLLSLTKQLV